MSTNSGNSEKTSTDFELGVAGFRYSDLFDAVKLAELSQRFYSEVSEREPALGEALKNISLPAARVMRSARLQKF